MRRSQWRVSAGGSHRQSEGDDCPQPVQQCDHEFAPQAATHKRNARKRVGMPNTGVSTLLFGEVSNDLNNIENAALPILRPVRLHLSPLANGEYGLKPAQLVYHPSFS